MCRSDYELLVWGSVCLQTGNAFSENHLLSVSALVQICFCELQGVLVLMCYLSQNLISGDVFYLAKKANVWNLLRRCD